MRELEPMGAKAGALLKARGERIAVAESSAGGLIAASLLAVPGASQFFVSGAVVYTARALKTLLAVTREDIQSRGMRSSSEPYAVFLATKMREAHRVEWAVSETGAAGPTGNPYGDPPGHSCFAVVSPAGSQSRTLRTGSSDRTANMWAFTEAALGLLVEALEAQTKHTVS
ncbi:MAG: nicotinamide-nucleotide amidohydrolase family protein [Alphaproteobacteria bacterium]|nr:nicotinamide-nucleotide amidohydrolase family protein [Alphaproteobacteria bacterium]